MSQVSIQGYGQANNKLPLLVEMEATVWLDPDSSLHISIGRLYWQGSLEDIIDGLSQARQFVIRVNGLYFQIKEERRSGPDLYLFCESDGHLQGIARFDLDKFSQSIAALASSNLDIDSLE